MKHRIISLYTTPSRESVTVFNNLDENRNEYYYNVSRASVRRLSGLVLSMKIEGVGRLVPDTTGDIGWVYYTYLSEERGI